MASFHKGDIVRVNKDIERLPESGGDTLLPYASKGETGEVIEIFYSHPGGVKGRPNAKVLIDRSIKTFCLTSLDRI